MSENSIQPQLNYLGDFRLEEMKGTDLFSLLYDL